MLDNLSESHSFSIDSTAFDAARKDLISLVGRVIPPPDLVVIVRNILLGAFSSLDNLVSYRSEVSTAGGAVEQQLFFEPSETLLGLLTAFRAEDWDTLIRRHGWLAPVSDKDRRFSRPIVTRNGEIEKGHDAV